LTNKRCSYMIKYSNVAMTCVEYLSNNTLLSGGSDGQIFTWMGKDIGKVFKAHTKAIYAIQKVKTGTGFWTGGNDGIL